MKYLITREQFLSKNTGSTIINEVLETPITWGGSLIGRLINSTIRRVKIGYNESQMDQVLVDLRNELDYLLSASLTGDAEKKLHEYIVKDYLQQIKDISLSTFTDSEKLEKLIGSDSGLYDPENPKAGRQKVKGLMKKVLNSLRDDFPGLEKIMGSDKDKMLNLLSDFTDELRKITLKDDMGNLKDPGSNISTTNYNRRTTVKVLDDLKKLIMQKDLSSFDNFKLFGFSDFLESNIENSDLEKSKLENKPKDNIEKDSNMSDIEIKKSDNKDLELKITNLQNLIKKHNTEEGLKKDLNIKKLTNQILSEIKNSKLSNTNINVSIGEDRITYIQYLSKFLDYLNSNLTEGLSYLFEEADLFYRNPEDVREVWERFFGELDAKEPHRLTDREKKEFDDMLKDPNNISKYYVYDPSSRPDPLISISRVLTNAYNLFATDYIPSGRPGGIISQKTLREYIKLGDKKNLRVAEAGYVQPDYGPWAVKSIFNKFKNGVLKILQNQEYRNILANMKFVVPGSEDKFNENLSILESDKNSSLRESHGQILLRFLNDVITPSKLGDFDDLKNKYISDYFGVKVSSKKEQEYKSAPTEKPIKESEKTEKLTWQSRDKNTISLFKSETGSEFKLFAFPSEFEDMPEYITKRLKEPNSKIREITNPEYKKNKKIIFLNRVLDAKKIDVKTSGDVMSFMPIKLTFDKSVVAETIKEKKGYKELENWNQSNGKNSIHYGYIHFLNDSNIYLVHCSVAENGSLKSDIKIILQKLKIGEYLNKNNSVLIDGRKGQPIEIKQDFTGNGEFDVSKSNLEIEVNGVTIEDIVSSELDRIFSK